MADAKFTPGPWEVGGVDSTAQRIVHGQHIEICTCWHHCVGSIEKEMEANARLIAAAPELLEALKATTEWIVDLAASGDAGFWDGEKMDEVISARAAIAKAEGR